MIRTITATEAKNRLGEWIKKVYQTNDHVIIEKGGIPVVAIIPIAEYGKLQPSTSELEPGMAEKLGNAERLAVANQKIFARGDLNPETKKGSV